jgi:hypothetical protein
MTRSLRPDSCWSFVPLTDAQLKGDDVYVAFDKDQVKDAPNIDRAARTH